MKGFDNTDISRLIWQNYSVAHLWLTGNLHRNQTYIYQKALWVKKVQAFLLNISFFL